MTLTERCELTHVVAVVVADDEQATQCRMPGRALEHDRQVTALVEADALHRAEVGPETLH